MRLKEVLEDHKTWTKDPVTGVRLTTKILNTVMSEVRGKGLAGANLSDADLLRSNLTCINLTGINLRGVNLRGVNLTGACLNDANLSEANLTRAELYRADLTRADLYRANLVDANLSEANLSEANLSEANLSQASCCSTHLQGADLTDANLSRANLWRANLRGAILNGTELPAPTVVLLARWDNLSPGLCSQAMRFDADAHLEGVEAFDRWANGGSCPYSGAKYQRACNFDEDPDLWNPSIPSPRAFDLMVSLILALCADSDYHEKDPS